MRRFYGAFAACALVTAFFAFEAGGWWRPVFALSVGLAVGATISAARSK